MSTTTEELTTKLQTRTGQGSGQTWAEILSKATPELERALPESMDVDQFTRIALTTIRGGLADCTPVSVVGSLHLCAQVGLEPGPLGHVWLVPRRNNRTGQKECNFQIGWQGWKELALRSERIVSIEGRPVYTDDDFDVLYGSQGGLHHRPSFNDRGLLGHDKDAEKPTHVYVFVRLAGGGEQYHAMTWADAWAHRGLGDTDRVWKQHPIPMALKACFLRLRPWLPTSVQLDRAVMHDESTPDTETPDMTTAPADLEPVDTPGDEDE